MTLAWAAINRHLGRKTVAQRQSCLARRVAAMTIGERRVDNAYSRGGRGEKGQIAR